MNHSKDVLETIKDVREYMLALKETGVDEVGIAAMVIKVHENPVCPPEFISGSHRLQGQEILKQVQNDRGVVQNDRGMGGFERLQMLRDKIGDCRRCKLWSSRTNIVFGTGNPDARLMFVGEGPGREEDKQGKPFVGRAGELLTKMITAMGLSRDNVFIANVIKCRPPDNRNPADDEIAACKPFLYEQIGLIKPDIVCVLGTFAAQTLLDTNARISDLRGRIHEKSEYKIVATFHPAYLLRNPNEKRRAWEDLQIVMSELENHSNGC